MKKVIIGIMVLLSLFLLGCNEVDVVPDEPLVVEFGEDLPQFESCDALNNAFEEARDEGGFWDEIMVEEASLDMAMPTAAKSATRDYSETNVQVEGVDEADIIKTDGEYIYVIVGNEFYIAKAYPADDAEILSKLEFDDFYPNEIFIYEDNVMLFGRSNYEVDYDLEDRREPSPYYFSATTVKLYDISDREDPDLIRTFDFEGNYLSSRMIGDNVYFVLNSYPRYYDTVVLEDAIVPRFRDSMNDEEFVATTKCGNVKYFDEHYASSFLTLVGMSISDVDADVNKELIVGSGQNVYASLENFYVAESYYNYGFWLDSEEEKTFIHKFELDDGDVDYDGSGYVPGRILNQFSMDEHDEHFRIATTVGHVSRDGESYSMNNVYVLDEDMDVVGELEDLAPGERIYSVRFMGEKGYVVTFKKVDPLFVIDLSEHDNPTVLGKLKIPGYSDYLHPFDENHIIGIGKDTVEAEEGDFAWYQGIKMAIFDVSDVENPIEMHKVIIGDRGTDSDALHNHKAFLFDRERELLVMPITLALIEDKEDAADNERGEYVFQGAYVFDINLEDGFELRGTVSHYDDDDVYLKSGYYFYGDSNIQRSLYIEDILYTMSNTRLQLNDLDSLERLSELNYDDFEMEEEEGEFNWGVVYG